jgi:hypothetical protein
MNIESPEQAMSNRSRFNSGIIESGIQQKFLKVSPENGIMSGCRMNLKDGFQTERKVMALPQTNSLGYYPSISLLNNNIMQLAALR